jgi:hypothetical protein
LISLGSAPSTIIGTILADDAAAVRHGMDTLLEEAYMVISKESEICLAYTERARTATTTTTIFVVMLIIDIYVNI